MIEMIERLSTVMSKEQAFPLTDLELSIYFN